MPNKPPVCKNSTRRPFQAPGSAFMSFNRPHMALPEYTGSSMIPAHAVTGRTLYELYEHKACVWAFQGSSQSGCVTMPGIIHTLAHSAYAQSDSMKLRLLHVAPVHNNDMYSRHPMMAIFKYTFIMAYGRIHMPTVVKSTHRSSTITPIGRMS